MQVQPNHNVWRVARAGRAAMLVDGANYFAAIRGAMIRAERSIMIAGWDIHTRRDWSARPAKLTTAIPNRSPNFSPRW